MKGRNVALKQQTWQSSALVYNGEPAESFKAVDGNTSNTFSDQSCTHTAVNQFGTWRVTFSTPNSINRYILYNRGNTVEYKVYTNVSVSTIAPMHL